MNKWLLKTEPSTYSFAQLQKDKKTTWDGVKNPLALKHMSSMKKGDFVLIYHTGSAREIVGLAKASSDAYPDPKLKNPKRFVVDLIPDRPLKRPLTLAEIKPDSRFKSFELVRMGRLSVMPVPPPLWKALLNLAGAA